MLSSFTKFIIRRTIYAVVTFFVALVLIFIIPRLIAVNPIELIAAANQLPPSATSKLISEFGLNKPVYIQFLYYVKNVMFSFPPNLGFSYDYYPSTVWSLIADSLPYTFLIVLPSIFIASIIGTYLGLYSGWKRGSKLDKASIYSSITIQSLPYFWIALILQILLAVILRIFPIGGALSISDVSPVFSFYHVSDLLYHAMLPIITLIVSIFPVYTIIARNNVIEVVNEDFVAVGILKGLKKKRILNTYVMRNAILPVITMISVNLGTVIGSSLLVQIVFNYPGIGTLLYDAILGHDYPLIEGIFYILALIVILGNYISDLFYSFIDPRIRYS